MQPLTYKIRLKREPDDGFLVTIPALPGCITYGSDLEQALDRAKEAIDLYLESLGHYGEEVPTEENIFEYSITVNSKSNVS